MPGQTSGEFKRFRDLTKKLAQVPKREVDELKAAKPRRRRSKPAPSG